MRHKMWRITWLENIPDSLADLPNNIAWEFSPVASTMEMLNCLIRIASISKQNQKYELL